MGGGAYSRIPGVHVNVVVVVVVAEISSQEQFGVALGFVAHLISHLSKVLLVPLQYPIKTNSSRSTISDHVSDEVIIDNIKE